MAKVTSRRSAKPIARPKHPQALDVSQWFRVAFDATLVYRDVRPPGRPGWNDEFRWQDVIRVCYEAEDLFTSDGIYFFTSSRPESYVIPVEAEGGAALVEELLRRGLFDPELLITASSSISGLFCWPPATKSSV